MSENRKPVQGEKLRGAEKVARIPVKVIPTVETPRKPDWIRVKMAAPEEVQRSSPRQVPRPQAHRYHWS